MKKVFSKIFMLSVGALAFTACADEYNPGAVTKEDLLKENYAKHWEDVFGTPDPNQDWSMATPVGLEYSIPNSGSGKLTVYTSRPGNPDCKILVSKSVSNTGSLNFDCPKNINKVYVEVVDGNNVVMGDYYAVKNGNIVASTRSAATRADCPVGRVFIDTKIDGFNLPDNVYNDVYYSSATSGLGIVNSWDVYNIPRNKVDEEAASSRTNGIFNIYTLSDYSYTKGDGNTWKNSDLAPIIGYGGVFEESCLSSLAASEGCAREEWYEDLKPNEGIDFLLGEGGPVELSLMYGATQRSDKFGYLYYQDGATIGEILQSPHYILLDDAQPMNLIEYSKAGGFADWNTISEDLLHATDTRPENLLTEDQKAELLSYEVTGTKIPLVYFAPDGTARYDFPENTHIVFFEMLEVGGNNNPTHWAGKIRYSRPDMNRFYGYELNEEHSPKPTVPEHEGDWRFITYSWGETVVAGLEDTGDDDMNDLLFSVKANITNKPKDINPDTPTTQKWLVACEDLGGSFDYDFNDIVLGFEKRDVSGTDHLFMKPLAAGGTLPAVVSFDSTEIGEIHQLMGASASEGIYDYIISGSADEVDLGECEAEFSITTAIAKLKIAVKGGDGNVVTIHAWNKDEDDTTPQMILLPGGWDWPDEGVTITNVYPTFVDWASSVTVTDWIKKAENCGAFITNTWGK